MAQQPKSCLACRVRHSKCDGTIPCAQCRLRNTNCTTTMPNKKDLPPVNNPRELTEVYMDHLKMKSANRQKKAPEAPAVQNRGLTAQYLQTLPLHELVALAKHQETEINDIDAKIYTASYHHYVDAEEDSSDIVGSQYGLPNDAPGLADALVGAYVSRNVIFYPEGKVPVDMVAATATLQRLISTKQFKLLIASSLPDLVDSFAYSVVFTYGAKILFKQDLALQLAIRTERLLKVMMDNGLSKSPSSVNKVLSLMGFHTVVLIGLGLDDIVRNSIALQQFISLPNKATVSATLISTVITHIAAITRDIPQRMRWIKAVEQLPSGSIPPYYDAYRVQHFAGDILLQEDGIHPFELLGKTPVEPELGLRQCIITHIDAALAKLPTYPPYTFRQVESAERSIKSIFYGAKAITTALLGNMTEAENLAEIAIQSIQVEDVNFCTTILVYSLTSALQVAIVARNAELMRKGILVLKAMIPEIPRTARHISRLEDYALQIGFAWRAGLVGDTSSSSSSSSVAASNGGAVASPPVFQANPDLLAALLNGASAASASSISAHHSPGSTATATSPLPAAVSGGLRGPGLNQTEAHTPFQAAVFSGWSGSPTSTTTTNNTSNGNPNTTPGGPNAQPSASPSSSSAFRDAATSSTSSLSSAVDISGPKTPSQQQLTAPLSPFTPGISPAAAAAAAAAVRSPYMTSPFFTPMLNPGSTMPTPDMNASSLPLGIGTLQSFPASWNSPMANFPVSAQSYSTPLLDDQIFLGPAFMGQRTSHEMPHPLTLLGGTQHQKHN